MKFKEVIGRITGFSVPIFGVSWNPPQPDVTAARKVLVFLEDRRVLYNPYNIESEDQCIYSVTEIRKFLTEIIGGLGDESEPPPIFERYVPPVELSLIPLVRRRPWPVQAVEMGGSLRVPLLHRSG